VLVCTGLIASMAALILGLLVSAAKASFDTERNSVQQLALNVVLLDRTLAHFGDEGLPARDQLKRTVTLMIDTVWPERAVDKGSLDDARITSQGMTVYDAVQKLSPQNDSQKFLQNQAFQLASDLARDRWRLSQHDEGSLPAPFLVVLDFWLSVLFISFGLYSPTNRTTIVAILVCALSMAGAVLLIVDLDQPLEGLLKISSAGLRDALSKLGQ